MLVIGIIGPKAVGKETVAEYIADKYQGAVHSHSEILDDVLNLLCIPRTRMNLIKLVNLRRAFEENVLVHALNKKIKAKPTEVVVVTGIRFENELQNIRSFPSNLVLFIDAPMKNRYEWQKKRVQKVDDQELAFEEFQRQETEETEIHIRALGNFADVQILNEGTKEELFAKIDQALSGKI